ncbi:uncharacterized protein A4U43_C07F37920 [Asparagus officinalis]|uniref:Uncharacterized protein n=1 Tax=Asparagus officinalis TaxID=4686 RepID=A0A5P1EK14_ASPOF|nr:uncharacterized protein LOC109850976 [Asparagus officinalis]ONK65517.1 uncharacterized protein A4U43_C07F37920 [Asparagus officinalis]
MFGFFMKPGVEDHCVVRSFGAFGLSRGFTDEVTHLIGSLMACLNQAKCCTPMWRLGTSNGAFCLLYIAAPPVTRHPVVVVKLSFPLCDATSRNQGDLLEADEQWRSQPRGGRKREDFAVEMLMRKRYAPLSQDSAISDGANDLRWLLSDAQ